MALLSKNKLIMLLTSIYLLDFLFDRKKVVLWMWLFAEHFVLFSQLNLLLQFDVFIFL